MIAEQSDWGRENVSCNNKTNYTRRHKFITHKNNCYLVFSINRNDQLLLVNEYRVRWQSIFAKKQVTVSRCRRTKLYIFSANPNHTPRLLTCEYFNFRWTLIKSRLPLFLLSSHWSLTNKYKANFLSVQFRKNFYSNQTIVACL